MNLSRMSFIAFIIPVLILVSVINSEEVTEEFAAQTISEDAFNQEESNEIHIDKKNQSVEINAKVAINVTNTVSTNTTKVNCSSEKIYGPVEIVNATRLMELLILEPGPSNRSRNDKDGKQLPGTCVLVLFYARWCVFSSQAAPHFNAIPRSFPHIKAVAIDAIKHQSFNAQYGIVGVPTLMLVHNGKPVAKFNDTIYTLESFAKFVSHLTNLQPNGSLYVTSADFTGPVSSTPSNEMDYCLVLSWIFIVACALYFTSRSRWWQQFVELIQITWLESNAEHEHVD
ncbi:PREDICTED: thioredoxin domain-containing protein 15 [Cyphomyrmex costatus]|uniref:Thioredoxin domain-containing protein 15 n=1 Tax=Cyphomyrmex costatus TaxID=456900 RepID=A0A195D8G6_9HYME|nr:PREDICTED: thioredoxin domain-containing protein 15 [Cyphomyrmex costatus]KYN08729.1 Thioredoxin domain-containing protein 15 [Cyphomyrmex costatus]